MKAALVFIALSILLIVLISGYESGLNKIRIHSDILKIDTTNSVMNPFGTKMKEASEFLRNKVFDSGVAVFIDYRKHSGRKRAYLADLKRKIIFDSFLVSHGCGLNNWGLDESKENPLFSNLPESHCSSLGKYKIGNRSSSEWGINIKYFLYGLDSTNSNAYKRTIVLHGWNSVPETEPFPNGTPEGWGCPAVSIASMKKLDSLLIKSHKPVLLWAY